MITQAIESMAEAVALIESYGLTRGAFLGVVTQTLFSSPSYQRYARNMVADAYEPGFKLALGLKDANLAADAARIASLSLPAAEVARHSLLKAFETGLGDHDWSALAKVVQDQVPRDRLGAPPVARVISTE
jgi:3-hydroxyisobutyrate dehydrogenase-like beta-hydroxyacid dehydrogenase